MRSCRTFGRSSRMSTEAPYDRVEIATKVADRYRTVRARSLRSMLQSRPGAPTILALTGAALPGRSPRRSWWCGQWSSGVRRLRASQHEHTNPVAGGATRPNGDDQKKERKRRSRTTRHPAFAMTKTCRSARVPSQSNPPSQNAGSGTTGTDAMRRPPGLRGVPWRSRRSIWRALKSRGGLGR